MSQAERRAVGAAVIVAALLALLVANRMSGPDVRGRALALPPLPPPASSACLVHSGAFDAVEVPCAQPHTAEVIRSWPAGGVPVVNGGAWRVACPTGESSRRTSTAKRQRPSAPAIAPVDSRSTARSRIRWNGSASSAPALAACRSTRALTSPAGPSVPALPSALPAYWLSRAVSRHGTRAMTDRARRLRC